MLLTIVLPTCSPEPMYKYFLPSIKNLQKLFNICSFAISFQPPYKVEQIGEIVSIIKSYGFDVKCNFKTYKDENNKCHGLLPIRQETALLYPDSKYYLIVDDDMEFLKGIDEQYINLLYLMEFDYNIGFTLLKREDITDKNIYYTDIIKEHFWTDASQIFRGGCFYGFKGIYPDNLLGLKGRGEDNVRCVWHTLRGESSLLIRNAQVIHHESSSKLNQHGEKDFDNDPDSSFNWLRNFNPMFLKGGKQSGWNFSNENAEKCFARGTKKKGIYRGDINAK